MRGKLHAKLCGTKLAGYDQIICDVSSTLHHKIMTVKCRFKPFYLLVAIFLSYTFMGSALANENSYGSTKKAMTVKYKWQYDLFKIRGKEWKILGKLNGNVKCEFNNDLRRYSFTLNRLVISPDEARKKIAHRLKYIEHFSIINQKKEWFAEFDKKGSSKERNISMELVDTLMQFFIVKSQLHGFKNIYTRKLVNKVEDNEVSQIKLSQEKNKSSKNEFVYMWKDKQDREMAPCSWWIIHRKSDKKDRIIRITRHVGMLENQPDEAAFKIFLKKIQNAFLNENLTNEMINEYTGDVEITVCSLSRQPS